MKTFFVLLTSLLLIVKAAPSCDTGWVQYKDELCIKLFDAFETYDEAKNLCSSQGSDITKSSLVMVKEADLQELLSNYTIGTFDYIWLGGKYDKETAQFKWEDGDPVIYSNWQEGYPSNTTESDNCIELRPTGSKVGIDAERKWADVICGKRNLVMCQKTLSWSLQDAVEEIMRVRKEHEVTREQLSQVSEKLSQESEKLSQESEKLSQESEKLSQESEKLSQVSERVVPVGSIYVEYFNQPSPTTLWPSLSWTDITGTYAGLFFRALGGGSATWGSTQLECSPRISQMQYGYTHFASSTYPSPINISTDGWSDYGKAGYFDMVGFDYVEALQFYKDGCEVRPTNQAVKIWKRTA